MLSLQLIDGTVLLLSLRADVASETKSLRRAPPPASPPMAGPKPLEASRERSRPSDELLFRCQAAEAENQRLMEMLKATEAQLEATKGELHHATAAAEHSVQGSLGTLEEIEELRATAAEWQAKAVEGERWEARAREAEAEVKRLHAAHGTLSGELSAAQLQRDE